MSLTDEIFRRHARAQRVVGPQAVRPLQIAGARGADQRQPELGGARRQRRAVARIAAQHHAVDALRHQRLEAACQMPPLRAALGQHQHLVLRLQRLAEPGRHLSIKPLAHIPDDQADYAAGAAAQRGRRAVTHIA